MNTGHCERSVLRRLFLPLVALTLSSAALAQSTRLGSFSDAGALARDRDWDYWSNPAVLCPAQLGDRVGIGTATPLSNLHIDCDNQAGGLRISWGDSYPTLYSSIGYTQTGGLVIDSRANGGWADIDLRSEGISRLFIERAGKVGIGTTGPSRNLEIDAAQAFLRITSSDADGSVLELKTTSIEDETWPGSIRFLDGTDATKAEIFHYDTDLYDDPGLYFNTAGSTRMMIHDDTGNVGIGTTNPLGSLWTDSKTLEIRGSAPSIVLDDAYGAHNDDFELSNGGGQVLFRDATDGINVMSLGLTGTSEGRIGIMTTNPQGTLDVNGAIYQRGGLLHADYVFDDDYALETIEEHARHMWKNKHLAAIPEVRRDENGYEVVEVGSHRRGIVEELEKAHIYIEQLHGDVRELRRQVEAMNERFAQFEGGLSAEEP